MFYRRDDSVQNGLGYAIPNCAVTYYTQPSLDLATVYNDTAGDEVISNPQYTDGLGHTAGYLAAGLYTITYSGMQIQTIVFPDQEVGAAGSGTTITVFAGIPQGEVNGVNRVFTLTNNGTPLTSAPTQAVIWKNFPLVPDSGSGTGYTLSGVTIVYDVAPQTTDTLYAQGYTLS